MFVQKTFWILFWAELLCTFWIYGSLPIGGKAYPTPFSYVGEHLIVWLAMISIVQGFLRLAKSRGLIVNSHGIWLPRHYLITGVILELCSSLYLWHYQSIWLREPTIWVDLLTPNHAFKAFIEQRIITWSIFTIVLSMIVLHGNIKQWFSNQASVEVSQKDCRD